MDPLDLDPLAPPAKPRLAARQAPALAVLAHVLRVGLVILIVAYLVHQIHRAAQGQSFGEIVARVQPLAFVAGTLVAAGALYVSALLWYYLLRINGVPLPLRECIQIFFYSHLGRYLPGMFWSVFGKIVLSGRSGIPPQVGAQCAALEAMIGVLAALSLSVTLLASVRIGLSRFWPLLFGVAAATVLVALHPRVFAAMTGFGLRLFRLPPVVVTYSFRQILTAYALQMFAWQVFGLAFFLLVRGVDRQFPWVAAAGVYATAWVVGYLSIFTPAGLGVREGMLVALLSAWLAPGPAAIVALASRVMTTAGELVGFLVLMGMKRRLPP
jgi:uncharacterized membrane protein YbhN (UPF0104 family)